MTRLPKRFSKKMNSEHEAFLLPLSWNGEINFYGEAAVARMSLPDEIKILFTAA